MLSGHPESVGPLAPLTSSKGSPWFAHANDQLTAWNGPWGVSYTANLTPDVATGLGSWDEQTFVDTLHSGKHMGKFRPLLPPMPWNWYGQLPDEDLKAIFAYLKSIPPVTNHVPVPTGPDGKPIS
jgi:hypothetical protein